MVAVGDELVNRRPFPNGARLGHSRHDVSDVQRITRARTATLYNPLAHACVLPREELLGQLVTAAIRILSRAGKVMIDPQFCRTGKIIRYRQNFSRGFALINFVLRKGTGGAYGEKLGRDPDKSREQQLLTIEFRPEARHGME